MRKLTKKISMLMVLAMLVGLFSGAVSASAASKWSFKSADGEWNVAPGETINLKKDQYENFDLYKNGAIADEATYTITWESSDEDVVWVNAKSGQLRAKKDAADGAEAVITANIVNVTTKKSHKVSFTIVVGEVKVDYTLQAPAFDEAVVVGSEVKFSTNVLDKDGKAVNFKTCGLYREYFMDGKAIGNTWTPAEAGEYTITVGAFTAKADTADLAKAVLTKDFKVVVRSDKAEIVAVEQVALNMIRVIFNDAFFAEQVMPVVKDDIEKAFELTFNADKDDKQGSNRVDLELNEAWISSVDKNVVYITTFKNLEENLTYKLSYLVDGSEVASEWVVGGGIVPAKVEVVEKGYVVGDYRTLEYKVYNKNDVVINPVKIEDRWVNLEGGFDETVYPVEWSLVGEVDEKSDFDSSNGSIYFLEKDAKATVAIKIDMGYDDDAKEIADVEDKGTVFGVDNTDESVKPISYLVATEKLAKDKFVASTIAQKFFIGQGDVDAGNDPLYIYAYYKTYDASGKDTDQYIENGNSTDGNNTDTFTYQSSNTDIVAVDEESGQVHPVAVGIARVYIKCEGKVIGYATVQVLKQPVLDEFNVSIEKGTKVSVVAEDLKADHHGIANQETVVKATWANQIDNTVGLEGITVNYELLSKIEIGNTDEVYDLDELFTVTEVDANKTKFVPKAVFADDILEAKEKITIKVKATATFECKDGEVIEKVKTFSFAVKNIEGVKAKDPVLDVTKSIDMNLATIGDGDNLSKRYGKITLTQSDAEEFFVRELPLADTFVSMDELKASDDAKNDGIYTIVITKGDIALDETDVNKLKLAPAIVENECDEPECATAGAYSVEVQPFSVDGDGKIEKADKGTYKVRLYKGNGTKAALVTTKTMQVLDTTPVIKAVKTKEWIDGYTSMDDLVEAMDFYRGDAKLKAENLAGIDVVADVDYKTDDTSRVYIYSIKFNLDVAAYNDKWTDATGLYTEETVYIKKTFTER